MEEGLLLLLLMAIVYLLFGKKGKGNSIPASPQIQPLEKAETPGKFDQYDSYSRYNRYPGAYFRERDAHDRHAKKLATHIRDNMTEPNSEGFVGYKGFWRNDFIVHTPNGKTYRGHIKLDEANYMISIKESAFGGGRHTFDLWEVEVE